MEFRGIKRAEEYANGKSSSSVFKENHIKDYLNGYTQALKDSKVPEMLEMLKRVLKEGVIPHLDVAELIKEATEI